ncbi:hypothetical protein NAEGRDRAFT_80437 [Naegleria gruberi]|uniref:RWP-RK domain-containing protein n=1 Tax=Naegleria gruberi TaxID=5762 RepID=D2VLF1_NAEGR|nr:uncharacterized protein NAEGRDRAFT_80437 [Naegleria gruberi]EFC42301.1 hypothetical protein NAEGRDRAFT_80437 [Naegleria gruberi]|eukprot:XP_002675045.1 hypothetical protein NAEGRDRAFT_80437 [Naegleria gruberi strain NEG-M]
MISQHTSLNYSSSNTNTCIPSHYSRPLSPPTNTSLPSIHSLKEFSHQPQYSQSCPVRTATHTNSQYPHHYYPLTHHHTNIDQQYAYAPVNNTTNLYHNNSNSSHSDALSSEDSNTSNQHVNRTSPSPIKVKNNKSDNKQKVKSPNTTNAPNTTNGIKKKRKTKKNKIIIATSELVRCMTLPQTVAAKKLKVSLSTLKRRFYELSVGRWPSIAPTNEPGSSSKTEEDMYVESTDATPEQKLSLSFIMNKKECPESSVIDNLSMVILKVAFTLNTNEEK